MAKKVTKRRPGRPRTTGIRPFTGARFSKEIVDEIDRFARQQKVSRSEAIRQLVERALADLKS
jgi:hypothetical protein